LLLVILRVLPGGIAPERIGARRTGAENGA
jgi:hypothetical protein